MDDQPRQGQPSANDEGATHSNVSETRNSGAGNSKTDTYRIANDSTEPMSLAVIRTVAALTDTDPTESEPLFAAVDPDALDDLVSTANGSNLEMAFEYAGHWVVVDGDREITVAEFDG